MGGLIDAIGSNFKSLLKLVQPISPIIAAALGGPLSGVAVSLLSNVFGANPKDITDLTTKIQQDPEAPFKIRQLECEHAATLAQIASEDYKTEVEDRKDARLHSHQYKNFLRHFAYFVTVGFFGIIIVLFLPFPVNQTERELLIMLIGMLASKWQTMVDYFYGSSRPQGVVK